MTTNDDWKEPMVFSVVDKPGVSFENAWKDAKYEPYDKEKQMHKMRGLTIQNPLMHDDKDYAKQCDLCMQIIGACFVKKYDDEPKDT